MLHSSGMHLHGVPLLFCVLPGCRDCMGYMRDSALYRNYILSTTQPCTAPRVRVTATPSSTMLIQGPCNHLTVCSSTPTDWSLSCNGSHCIPAELHRHRQPAPSALGQTLGLIRINRLIQGIPFSLCIHSPASVMLNMAPAYLYLYFSPFRHGETCFLICLAWLWWWLEAPVSRGRSQEGCNHRLCKVSCLQLPRLFLKPARMAIQSSDSL